VNYQRIYQQFIADRKAKEPECYRGKSYGTRNTSIGSWVDGEYYEHHHVTPKSMGGDNSAENVVSLTAEDHFFAHLCLAKWLGGEQWRGVHCLINLKNKSSIQGRSKYSMRPMVGFARKQWARYQSESKKGVPNPSRGVHGTVFHEDGREVSGYCTTISKKTGLNMTTVYNLLTKKCGRSRDGWFAFQDEKEKAVLAARAQGIAMAASTINGCNSKKVICLDTGEVFDSATCAEEKIGFSNVTNVCLGKRSYCGGKRWAYFNGSAEESESEWQKFFLIRKVKRAESNKKKGEAAIGRSAVKVINVTTGEVYSSMAEAAEKTGCTCISDACSGKRKSSGGFIWSYYEENKIYPIGLEPKKRERKVVKRMSPAEARALKRKRLFCVTDGREYASMAIAASSIGASPSAITYGIKNNKPVKGFEFRLV